MPRSLWQGPWVLSMMMKLSLPLSFLCHSPLIRCLGPNPGQLTLREPDRMEDSVWRSQTEQSALRKVDTTQGTSKMFKLNYSEIF